MSGIVLTKAEITALLAQGRNRGGNENFLKGFVASGEMYAVVNEHPNYTGKSKEQMVSVKNALVMKAKALDITNVKLVKTDDGDVVIVNTALLAEASTEDE